MSWIAIWDGEGAVRAPRNTVSRTDGLSNATIFIEGRLINAAPVPVLLWSGTGDAASRFDLHRMPDGAIRVKHRDLCVLTEPGLLSAGETFQMHYRADEKGSSGILDFVNLDAGHRVMMCPGVPVTPCLADFMPENQAFLAPLSLAAVATHDVPIGPVPGIASGTLINTPQGPTRVENLRPGMLVDTLDAGPQPVRWTESREVLCRGTTAPVLLRAPYFGLPQDIIVTADHRILMDGSEVEYLFGEERVYARAGDMVNSMSVRRDQSTLTRIFHQVMLDDHDCLQIGRCRIETLLLADMLASKGKASTRLDDADSLPRYPTLDRASAQTLLSLIVEHRRIAA